MDNQIISYMSEQYPDILDAYEDSVLQDGMGDQFLEGVVEAYEHIINKFGSLYEGS